MKEATIKYSNGEVTILWKPKLCIHSGKCWKGEDGLIAVFNPAHKPWIDPMGANTERIIEQIKKCPSGALSFEMNRDETKETVKVDVNSFNEVIIEKNGPLIIKGTITITDQNGNITQKKGSTSFCRCGLSQNKPYCDNSHEDSDFKED